MSTHHFPHAFERAAHACGFEPAHVVWPESVGSTNDELVSELMRDADAWPDFSIYGTEFQNAGKGRLDRQWTVEPGEALTFSTVFRAQASENLGWVPLLTGWAVVQAIRGLGVEASVKWPNDVLIDGKKVCGILCRYVSEAGVIVIGAGINVHMNNMPVDTATSLHHHGDIDRAELLARIMLHLQTALTDAFESDQPAHTQAVTQACSLISTVGQHVRVSLPGDTALEGQAIGISPSADLRVRTDSGVVDVSAGDVVHVRPA